MAPPAQAAGERPRCGGARATAVAGADGVLRGGGRDDVLRGSARRDRISGGGGDDVLCGARGRDRLRDGPGRDRVKAGSGRDRIVGGGGEDQLRGGAGGDTIEAGDGRRDEVRAGAGDDVTKSRDGVRETVDCGGGDDLAYVDDRDVLDGCERVRLGVSSSDFTLPPWSDAQWIDPQYFETIGTGDVDGDGDEEIFGRAGWGIDVWRMDRELGQWVQMTSITGNEAFLDRNGWDQPQYYSTMQAADLDGDGADEIVGRGSGGLAAWQYQPTTGGWRYLAEATGDDAFSDAHGWDEAPYYETIGAADLDGDGSEEVYGRGSGGIAAFSYSAATNSWEYLPEAIGPDGFSDANGWNRPPYYATIGDADLDGDGDHEVYGRGSGGIAAWSYDGTSRSWSYLPEASGPDGFSDANDWNQPEYYLTIGAADLDGDGRDEVFGRGSGGIASWGFRDGAWDYLPVPFLDGLSDANDWNQPQYYLTIQAADLDGDGAAEILGRYEDGMHAWKARGGAWDPLPVDADFQDDSGWNLDHYYPSLQTADVTGGSAEELLGRFTSGVVGVGYNAGTDSWRGLSAAFPVFSGAEHAAYEAINQAVGGPFDPQFDLRSSYPGANYQQLVGWAEEVREMAQPEGVSAAAWQAVQTQVTGELDDAGAVSYWYETYLNERMTDLFVAESMDQSAQILEFDIGSNEELTMQEWDLFEGVVAGFEVFDAADGAGEAVVVLTSLISSATSGALGAGEVNTALDGIEGTYLEIQERLQSDFTSAIAKLGTTESQINSDYGLLSAVGGMINSGRWTELEGDELDASFAGAERAYARWVWRTIAPQIWVTYRFPPEISGDFCVDGDCDWVLPDGTGWMLAYTHAAGANCNSDSDYFGPCNPVAADIRAQLFTPTSEACQANWDLASCDLGVPPPEVFQGQGGWGTIPSRHCSQAPIDNAVILCPDGDAARSQ